MRKYIPEGLSLLCCCLLLIACYTAAPGKYFDIAVVNSNVLVGFADSGLLKQLEFPPVKIPEKKSKPPAVKRADIINTKIETAEANLKKVKELTETGDTEDMLQTSVALYEYVLPVYKIEYTQLAALYDKGAPKKLIQPIVQAIHDKYYAGYEELFTKLIMLGKSYASEHAIKVNW